MGKGTSKGKGGEGGATGTIIESPRYRARRARRRREEDARWKSLNGPVTVSQLGPRVESGHERQQSAGETTGGAVVRERDGETLATGDEVRGQLGRPMAGRADTGHGRGSG